VTSGTPSCSTLAVMHISDTPPGAVASASVGKGTAETRPSRAAKAKASTIDIAAVSPPPP
jgi:hypothetical protein